MWLWTWVASGMGAECVCKINVITKMWRPSCFTRTAHPQAAARYWLALRLACCWIKPWNSTGTEASSQSGMKTNSVDEVGCCPYFSLWALGLPGLSVPGKDERVHTVGFFTPIVDGLWMPSDPLFDVNFGVWWGPGISVIHRFWLWHRWGGVRGTKTFTLFHLGWKSVPWELQHSAFAPPGPSCMI